MWSHPPSLVIQSSYGYGWFQLLTKEKEADGESVPTQRGTLLRPSLLASSAGVGGRDEQKMENAARDALLYLFILLTLTIYFSPCCWAITVWWEMRFAVLLRWRTVFNLQLLKYFSCSATAAEPFCLRGLETSRFLFLDYQHGSFGSRKATASVEQLEGGDSFL